MLQDADYEASGAKLVETAVAFQSDIVLKVRPPSIAEEVPQFKPGGHLVSYIQPALNKELVEELQKKKMTAIGVTHQACVAVEKISNQPPRTEISPCANVFRTHVDPLPPTQWVCAHAPSLSGTPSMVWCAPVARNNSH